MGQEPTHPELLDYLAAELIENGWSLKRLHRELLTSSFYQTESRPPVDQEGLAKWGDSLTQKIVAGRDFQGGVWMPKRFEMRCCRWLAC